MRNKYFSCVKIAILVMVLTLAACSGTTEPSASPETTSPETATPGNEPVIAPAVENEEESVAKRPQTENFDMMTAEGNQTQTATLHQGEGYSLYVFEEFSFDAAEGRLFLSSNPQYEVKIEALPADYDLTQLKSAGKRELEQFGEISDYSGELVEHPLGYAEIYLQASSGEGINDYMVWKSGSGDAFLFRLRNPKGEEASDFAGPVLVSLSSVEGILKGEGVQ